MLIISGKKNIKIIPLFVAISFILQFGSILVGYDEYPVSSSVPANMFYFYQPAMYAIAKILTEGLHAYLQCIFLGVPADSDILTGFCFEVMPYILGLFLLFGQFCFLSEFHELKPLPITRSQKFRYTLLKPA